MNLIKAVQKAHKMRDIPMDIEHHGYYFVFGAVAERQWREYDRILATIKKRNRVIYSFLNWIGYI